MMNVVTNKQVEAGQAIYNRYVLAAYDLLVLGVSCQLFWRCPSHRMEAQYNKFASNNHLDVGVGTGYFLDRCQFSSDNPRIALMDLNKNSLNYTAERIVRYTPETYCRNILDPISIPAENFDSIGINFLLHCVPGNLSEKSALFDNLKTLMNPNAVIFGSTILSVGVSPHWLAQRLMNAYNNKGVFSNTHDSAEDLKRELGARFTDVSVEIVGCVALFSARK
jgi:2-polyprenyl-3-methyl-5-hydroxy-6-metoxy-1,4-benzoquinol methylase